MRASLALDYKLGCFYSSQAPQAVAARRARQTFDFLDDENPPPPPPPLDLSSQLKIDVNNILQGLVQVIAPEELIPVVCFKEHTFPLFLGSFNFDESSDPIVLPVICISRLELGKIVFVGSVDFVSHQLMQRAETSAFVENMISWGSDFKSQTMRIVVLGISQSITSTLQNDFSSYGFEIEVLKEKPSKISANIMFLSSDYDCNGIGEMIMDFVKNGGTLFVFGVKNSTYPINGVLEESGLAFSVCTLKSTNEILEPSNFDELNDVMFCNVKKRYEDFLDKCNSKDDVDLAALDKCVSQLRYYVSEFGEQNAPLALELTNKSYQFLQKIGYDNGDTICPDVIHSVITVMLMELIPKIAPRDVTPAPKIDLFPGLTGNVTLGNIKLKMTIKPDIWNQTGIWIPAGKVAGITSDYPITLQIGAHSLCLLLKPGPWKRWPTIVTRVHIEPNKMTLVATPFGGIAYILTEKAATISLVFSNVTRHPHYVEGKSNVWDSTKNYDVPWGELLFKTVCLTLPTKKLKAIKNIKAFGAALDHLITNTLSFVGIRSTEIKRIVFDIDLPKNEPICGECIFMDIEYFDALLQYQDSSTEILQLLTYICLHSIPMAFYDSEIELIISTLAACHSMIINWPDDPPVALIPFTPSKLFDNLWDLYSEKGVDPFAKAMQFLLNNKDISNATEAWGFFIKKLETECKKKLGHLADRFGHSGQLAQAHSDKLNVYQLEDAEM